MNLNPNDRDELGAGIQSLLYVNLIVHKKASIKEVADKMGIQPDTLYKYAEGRQAFPAERLGDLVRATGDHEYLAYVADKADLIVLPKTRVKACVKSIRQIEIELAIADGALMSLTEDSLADDEIDGAELKKVLTKANEAIRHIESLKESLKAKMEGREPGE